MQPLRVPRASSGHAGLGMRQRGARAVHAARAAPRRCACEPAAARAGAHGSAPPAAGSQQHGQLPEQQLGAWRDPHAALRPCARQGVVHGQAALSGGGGASTSSARACGVSSTSSSILAPWQHRRRALLAAGAAALVAAAGGAAAPPPAAAAGPTAPGGNSAVLEDLKRLQKQQRLFGGEEPRAALAERFEAARAQLQRCGLLVKIGQYDNARMQLREGAFSKLRLDLGYGQEMYRVVSEKEAREVVQGVERLDQALKRKEAADVVVPQLERLQQQLKDITVAIARLEEVK